MTWNDVPGWFDFGSGYSEAVDHFDGGTLVEVGCYLGRSLCYLGQAVKDTGKPFRVVGVDWCRGSGEENDNDNHAAALTQGGGTLAGLLHSNIQQCGLADTVTLLVAPADTAATFFAPNSLEFVFLDAKHDYESVKQDIGIWIEKVRPGGWLAGDDYCAVWPGVIQAVEELLPGHTAWSWDSFRYIKS